MCALPSGTVSQALDFLGCSAEVVALDPHSLDEVLESIRTVGKHAGVEDRADQLVCGLRARLDAVADAVAGRPRPRVAIVEWVDPPFPGGHWVPDLVRAAGGEPVAALPGQRSRAFTWAEFAAAEPDVVIVSPCGYHLDGAAEQARVAADALPGAAVWAIDGDGLVVRPGPRVVDGVEAIAAILHPEVMPARPGAVRCVRAGRPVRA